MDLNPFLYIYCTNKLLNRSIGLHIMESVLGSIMAAPLRLNTGACPAAQSLLICIWLLAEISNGFAIAVTAILIYMFKI